MGITAVAATSSGVGVISASLILGAFILKLVDLVKSLVAGLARADWNAFLTLTLTWVVGFVAIIVFINTQWGGEIQLGHQTLDHMNTWAKVVFALAAPSVASVLYDTKKAVDNTDTASTSRLTNAADAARKANVRAVLGPKE